MTGYERTFDVKNETRSGVEAFVTRMRDELGVKVVRDIKTQHTRTPSVQGNWHPFRFAAPTPAAKPVAKPQ